MSYVSIEMSDGGGKDRFPFDSVEGIEPGKSYCNAQYQREDFLRDNPESENKMQGNGYFKSPIYGGFTGWPEYN